MSSLLLGCCWDSSITDANSPTFQWINSLLMQQNDKVREPSNLP